MKIPKFLGTNKSNYSALYLSNTYKDIGGTTYEAAVLRRKSGSLWNFY